METSPRQRLLLGRAVFHARFREGDTQPQADSPSDEMRHQQPARKLIRSTKTSSARDNLRRIGNRDARRL